MCIISDLQLKPAFHFVYKWNHVLKFRPVRTLIFYPLASLCIPFNAACSVYIIPNQVCVQIIS